MREHGIKVETSTRAVASRSAIPPRRQRRPEPRKPRVPAGADRLPEAAAEAPGAGREGRSPPRANPSPTAGAGGRPGSAERGRRLSGGLSAAAGGGTGPGRRHRPTAPPAGSNSSTSAREWAAHDPLAGASATAGDGAGPQEGTRRLTRRRLAVAALLAAVIAVVAIVLVSGGHGKGGAPASGIPAGDTTATVERRTLTESSTVDGTLGYGDTLELYDRLTGTYTWLPSVGATIARGGTLFRVDNLPVVLMYGSVPAYRTLEKGVSDGPDVVQLNRNLIALGYDPYGAIADIEAFSEATEAAVRRWQKAEGLSQTGERGTRPGRVRALRPARDGGEGHARAGPDRSRNGTVRQRFARSRQRTGRRKGSEPQKRTGKSRESRPGKDKPSAAKQPQTRRQTQVRQIKRRQSRTTPPRTRPRKARANQPKARGRAKAAQGPEPGRLYSRPRPRSSSCS